MIYGSEKKRRVINLVLNEGKTQAEAARIERVPQNCVSLWVLAAKTGDASLNSMITPNAHKHHRSPDPVDTALALNLSKEGKSVREIALELGVPHDTVYSWVYLDNKARVTA